MAGILLSGWRIRLFDSAGNPLYPGKVEFFDATTSLPKTVYSDKDLTIVKDGNPLVKVDSTSIVTASTVSSDAHLIIFIIKPYKNIHNNILYYFNKR